MFTQNLTKGSNFFARIPLRYWPGHSQLLAALFFISLNTQAATIPSNDPALDCCTGLQANSNSDSSLRAMW